MFVQELLDSGMFEVVNAGNETSVSISKVYCGDLLSVVMGRAPERCAWVTVMGNINTLAVLALTDAACIILAEGAVLDESAMNKARQEQITVMSTDMPIFEAALYIHQRLND